MRIMQYTCLIEDVNTMRHRKEKNAPVKGDHPVNILSGADGHNPDCGSDDDWNNTTVEILECQ